MRGDGTADQRSHSTATGYSGADKTVVFAALLQRRNIAGNNHNQSSAALVVSFLEGLKIHQD